MDIKEIYCFGTSYTAGGGFEWGISKRSGLENYYHEYPRTQYNYSWPGQLQKIVGPEIKVINLAQSGFGNDMIIRTAYDVISKTNRLDDKLFLFEFVSVGRTEFWSNTFDSYVITNWLFDDDGKMGSITGMADRYYSPKQMEVFSKLKPIIEPYLKESIFVETEIKKIDMNIKIFIDYLLYNEVNFKIVHREFALSKHKVPIPLIVDPLTDKPDIVNFRGNHVKVFPTVIEETNGEVIDSHGGFEWVKHIAKRVANAIGLNNNPIEPYIRKSHTKPFI